MGDRSNVEFKYENGEKVYFYTHWTGSELPITVAAALARGKGRWGDESYLARIIFSEMIQDNVLDETGYGIAPYIGDGDVKVRIDSRAMTANGVSFKEFVEAYTVGVDRG